MTTPTLSTNYLLALTVIDDATCGDWSARTLNSLSMEIDANGVFTQDEKARLQKHIDGKFSQRNAAVPDAHPHGRYSGRWA